MSRARDNVRKEKMAKRIEAAYADGSLTPDDVKYRNSIRNKIKAGKLPRYHLVKGEEGSPKTDPKTGLPRNKIKGFYYNAETKQNEPVYRGLAFIQVSTMDMLCKKIPQLKE